MTELHIAPNRPLTVALLDPEGRFDFETGMGQYQTTTGELVTLPRPAVVLLNTLDPQPGEEITICKHWSGRPGEKAEWTISLSPKSENTRAEAEKAASDLTGQLERSIEAIQARKAAVELPTPIRRPARSRSTPEVQPRLFDRGTGTYGPAPAAVPLSIPLPAVAIGRAPKVGQIPIQQPNATAEAQRKVIAAHERPRGSLWEARIIGAPIMSNLTERMKSDIARREKAHAQEMQGPLHPPVSLLCKLGSIVVHADEAMSPDGHHFDAVALKGLIADLEVSAWLDGMRKAAFLPIKRRG